MDFSIDVSAIIAALLFGVIGMWMFKEGRRLEKDYVPWIGVSLMIYPYFVDGYRLTWGIGIILCFLAYNLW